MSEERVFTAAEVDAAVQAISDPARLTHAQEVMTHAAPALQRILGVVLDEGGYFDGAHDAKVTEIATIDDPEQRALGLRTLLADETRLGMLVGAAVGFELARELTRTPEPAEEDD